MNSFATGGTLLVAGESAAKAGDAQARSVSIKRLIAYLAPTVIMSLETDMGRSSETRMNQWAASVGMAAS